MKDLKKHISSRTLLLIASLFFNKTVLFSQIFVAPNGSDKNSGSYKSPIRSFEKAQQMIRSKKGDKLLEVIFKPGIYYLPETVKFTSADNKENGVIYRAEKEGAVIISGGKKLNLFWKPYRDNIFVADVTEDVSIDQLFINGIRQRMARFPNAKSGKSVYDAWDLSHTISKDSLNDPLLPVRIHTWKNPAGAYLHAMHNALWGDMHWLIRSKMNDSLDLVGGWQNNRPSKMHSVYRMVENVFEELDAPGEWYYNNEQHKLYYYPDTNLDLKKCTVEIVRLKHLIEFNGSMANPVKDIQLAGFVFKHASRTFMENKEPLQRSDWTVYRGGAILYNGAENCSIKNCEFDRVGGNTIFINNYNRDITIKGCYIHHSGASGILFVGDSSSIRSPLYGYVKRDYRTMDTVKGPRNENFPKDCLVEDCLITLTGRDEKQTAGIHISVSHNIHVNHCTIYDMPRAGININEGSFGGHIIENSDIFNTVLETGDHGSFNSWGRDRYWTGDGKTVANELELKPEMYLLDILSPNIIRHNRWRCDFGWDIDLDDGSSHYRIYDNVLLSRGLKLREGYDRIVTNNIILNNSLHPHVWFPKSGDVFKHNIVYSAYRPAIMNKFIPETGKWGASIDSNLFVCDTAQMHRFIKNGCDSNSIAGDPMFENPHTGDYRIKAGSPALKIGFKNIPTIGFGVVKSSLKAIAKQPTLPEITSTRNLSVNQSKRRFNWMNAEVSEPSGEEFSAYGIGFNEGGISLNMIDPLSRLLNMGFKKGDIIHSINGTHIKNIHELKTYLGQKIGVKQNFVFELVRNQQKMKIEFYGECDGIQEKMKQDDVKLSQK